jgi:cation transporter-like permease
MSEAKPEPEPEPRPKRQFTIRAILFVTLLVSVAAAGFSGLLRAEQGSATLFVVFVIAAPLGLLLVASVARAVEGFIIARRRRDGRE